MVENRGMLWSVYDLGTANDQGNGRKTEAKVLALGETSDKSGSGRDFGAGPQLGKTTTPSLFLKSSVNITQ